MPIKLEQNQVDELMELTKDEGNSFTVDLEKQKINAGNKSYDFDVDAFRKKCLIEGLDDIGLTLKKDDKISEFEASYKEKVSWL